MAPLRRASREFDKRHPNAAVLIFALWAVLVTCLGTYSIIRVRDQQQSLATVASAQIKQNCITSNAARESLRDLLLFARRRVVQTAPALHTPPEQVQAALDFYDQALDRIKIIPCPPPVEK